MQTWKEIRQKYPNHYLILKNYKENRIDEKHIKITNAEVLLSTTSLKKLYTEYKKRKNNRLICCNTQDEVLIIEEIPFMTLLNNEV